jgi:ribA/ribD-fused uncharacterized protein
MENEQYEFFYGGIFSQWYIVTFRNKDEIVFNCAEQYMMWNKAIMFRDDITAGDILKEKNPRIQKRLGRLVKNFNKERWEKWAKDIVYKGNYLKYTQNKDLLKYLLDTNDKILVEASPSDTIWGVGLSEDDPRILHESTWRGTNWLGEVLTKLKYDLRGIL